jgi:hypothetical protein
MTDFGDWFQGNWYQLGSFFVQFGFLAAAIWFADRILKTLRASQEQVGALLKLSVSASSLERPAEPAIHSRVPEASPYWLPPTPAKPAGSVVAPQVAAPQKDPNHLVSSGPGFVGWLKTPMSITSGTSSFHRVLRWFQSPAHS